jgi:hypothetical protein
VRQRPDAVEVFQQQDLRVDRKGVGTPRVADCLPQRRPGWVEAKKRPSLIRHDREKVGVAVSGTSVIGHSFSLMWRFIVP